MKRKNIIIGLLSVFTIGLLGCTDAEYGVIDNGVYFSEAGNGKSFEKIVVEAEGKTIASVTARLAKMVATDTKVKVEVAPQLLENYNTLNATSYEVLPSEYFEYSAEAVIKAGALEADPTNLAISPYETPNSEQYAIPLRLTTLSGSVGALSRSTEYIILLDKPLIQAVPELNYSHSPHSDGEWGYTTSEWSLELWVNMSSFTINNQAVVNISASTEIYIRYGDAGIDYHTLQIKTAGSQVNAVTLGKENTWTHIAFTYSATGLLTIYVNGKSDVVLQTAHPGVITFNGISLASSGSSYFRAKCRMAQIRLWKKALSETQIQSNMNYPVNPSNPDLMGYWKLDEGDGAIFKDSANEKNMTMTGTPTWIPNIRF